MKKKAIVSACLLGVECRYDGGSNKLPDEKLRALKEKYELIPVCPECYGGLTTPRVPSERVGDKVLSKTGTDVTDEFSRGAQAALYLAKLFGADVTKCTYKPNGMKDDRAVFLRRMAMKAVRQ